MKNGKINFSILKGLLLIFITIFLFMNTAYAINISTESDLRNISNDLSGDYVLMNNITVNGEWTPIGTKDAPFTGTLKSDGARKYFINLTTDINYPNQDNIGLFGYTDNATFDRLIVNANVTGNNSVGIVIGYATNTTLTDCSSLYVEKNVTGKNTVGGLVGFLNGGKIENCSAGGTSRRGNITAVSTVGGMVGYIQNGTVINVTVGTNVTATSTNSGGLVGNADRAQIMNSYSASVVKANKSAGGLAGATHSSTIQNNYVTGTVTAQQDIAGGLIGNVSSGIVQNNYATGAVTAQNIAGGLIGKQSTTKIEMNYAIGAVTATTNAKGLVGNNTTTINSNNFYDTQTTGITSGGPGTPKTTAEMKNIATYEDAGWSIKILGEKPETDWKMSNLYPVLDWQPASTNTSVAVNNSTFGYIGDRQVHIDANGNERIWTLNSNYTLIEDINVTTAHNFKPVGSPDKPFTGKLNGQNFTISNLSYHNPTEENVGLFGYTDGTNITNVRLENFSLTGKSNVGSAAGHSNNTTITNVSSANGTIISKTDNAGGLIGKYASGRMNSSYSNNQVTAEANNAGGIIGDCAGSINNCYSIGETKAMVNNAGGVIGLHGGNIANRYLYAAGPVSSGNEETKGGLVGLNTAGSVTSSFYDINMTGCNNSSGGIRKNTSEMYNYSTFSTWNISKAEDTNNTIWKIHDNESFGSYPYLSWQTGAPVQKFNITYHANYDDAPTLSKIVTGYDDVQIQIASNGNGITRSKYVFVSWTENTDGTGTNYTGQKITLISDMDLYAQWREAGPFKVTYDANGGQDPPTDTKSYTYQNTVTVKDEEKMSRVGYRFAGWNTEQNGSGTAYAGNAQFAIEKNTTLYAQWTVETNKFTVTYNANGGAEPPQDSSKYQYSQQVTVKEPEGMNREGYKFKEWNTLQNGTGTAYAKNAQFRIKENTTLYAQWEQVTNKFAVTYNANGGQQPPQDSKQYNYSQQVTVKEQEEMNREGFKFKEWNTLQNGAGTAYAENAQFRINENVTLYAQWEQVTNKFAVTYNANGGQQPPQDSNRYNYSQQVTVKEHEGMNREGFKFKEWNTLQNGAGTVYAKNAQFRINENVTLYAQWEQVTNKFAVTYDANEGQNPPQDSNRYNYSQQVTVKEQEEMNREGFKFKEWNTLQNGAGTAYAKNAQFRINENVTLYAQWETETNKFAVTYDANEGQNPPQDSNQYNYSEQVTVKEQEGMNREGFKFKEWNTVKNGSGTAYAENAQFRINENVTLYAQWETETEKFTVTYDANEGQNPPQDSSQYNYSQQVTVKEQEEMNREGHKFKEWNTVKNGSGTVYAENAQFRINENVTLYAQWETETNKFTVTYDANEGQNPPQDSNQYNYSEQVTVKEQEEMNREGHKFKEWNTVKNGSGTVYAENAQFRINENVTLYAQWETETDKFTVTYDANEGQNPPQDSSQYNYSQQVTVKEQEEMNREGHKFKEWNTVKNGSGTVYAENAQFRINENVTLYAQWETETDKFTVTYDANEGQNPPQDSSQYNYSQQVTVKEQDGMNREGYKFKEWNTVKNGSGTVYAENAQFRINENVTLYAQWETETDKFTVTYDANEGQNPPQDSSQYNYSQQVTVKEQEEMNREGHKFKEWNTAKNGSGTVYAENAQFRINENVTLYAQWETENDKFTITYDANEGQNPPQDSNQYNYSEQVTVKEQEEMNREGHKFKEWNTAKNGSGTVYAENAQFRINENVTLYAQWETETDKFTITYDANEGQNPPQDSNQYNYSEQVTVKEQEEMNREGHKFKEWNTVKNGSGTVYAENAQFRINENVTLYAQWETETDKFTITYDANEGQNPPQDSNQYNYSELVTVKGKGTMHNSDNQFTGWNTEQDGVGTEYAENDTFRIKENTTLYAQWTDEHIAVNNETFGYIGDGAEHPDATGISKMWTPDAVYRLTEDVLIVPSHNFKPIGDESNPFTGSFDGKNFVISYLRYEDSNADNIGLFGYTDGAEISNISLENAVLKGKENVGSLIGTANNTTVKNSSSANGSVSAADMNSGGLAGNFKSGTIENSYSAVSVNSENSNAGGIVGNADAGTIQKTYAVGLITAYEENTKGGIAGTAASGIVEDSFYDSQTTGCSDTGKGEAKTTYSMRNFATFDDAGWDIRKAEDSRDTLWKIYDGKSYPHFSKQDAGQTDPEKDISVNNATFRYIGDGAEHIDAAGNNRIWSLDANYTLIEDTEIGYSFTPIGNKSNPFTGTFEGQNHTISDLSFEDAVSENAGLFGVTDNAEISNIILENASVRGKENVGTLIGTADNTIVKNSTSLNGSATADDKNAGGLIGTMNAATVENNYALVNVSAAENAGGLIGLMDGGTVENTFAAGEVNAGDDNSKGGLIGAKNGGSVLSSFYDSDRTGCDDTGKGEAKTTKTMNLLETFNSSGWNIRQADVAGNTLWKIYDERSYPHFDWQAVQPNPYEGSIQVNSSTFEYIGDGQIREDAEGKEKLWSLDADYILTENITIAGTQNFVPIGTEIDPFTGTFDGQNHTVSDLTVNAESDSNIGLFGSTDGAEISNIRLENVSVKGQNNAGSLIGTANETVVRNSASMSGKVEALGSNAGGLIGNMESGTVTNSYAIIEVTAADCAGGLIGNADDGFIRSSYSAGLISSGSEKGGLIGIKTGGTVENSFYDAKTSECSDTGKGEPKTNVQIKSFETFEEAGWDIRKSDHSKNTVWVIHDGWSYPMFDISEADAHKTDSIHIDRAEQIHWIGDGQSHRDAAGEEKVWTLDANYVLIQNITADNGFEPIGTENEPFSGTLDGQGFVISGLRYETDVDNNIGLFGYTDGATISNIGLVDVNFKGLENVAGVAGSAKDTIIANVHIKNGVIESGNDNAGGIVGTADESVIKTSYAAGDIVSRNYAGGIAGSLNNSLIQNSYAVGNVSAEKFAGGIGGAGDNATVDTCYAVNNVTATIEYAGGMLGYAIDSNVKNCFALNEYVNSPMDGNRIIGHAVDTGFTFNLRSVEETHAWESMKNSDGVFDGSSQEKYGKNVSSKEIWGTFSSDSVWNSWNKNIWTQNSHENFSLPVHKWLTDPHSQDVSHLDPEKSETENEGKSNSGETTGNASVVNSSSNGTGIIGNGTKEIEQPPPEIPQEVKPKSIGKILMTSVFFIGIVVCFAGVYLYLRRQRE